MKALSAGKLAGIRRLADAAGRFKMTAADQRPPIINPIKEKRGGVASYEDVTSVKRLIVEELQGASTAFLLDPNYAYPAVATLVSPHIGMIMTLEESNFRETPEGRLSAEIDGWSVGKIRRCGGDGVKVLAWYRPDAPESVNRHQQAFVRRVGEECLKHDIPYVFELLVYPLPGEKDQTSDYIEMSGKKAELVLESVREFAKPEYGVDIFKLESPVPARECRGHGAPGTEQVQAMFDEMGRIAGRPWVMLSAGAPKDQFRNVLTHAYAAGASGYLAGRAIWLDAFRNFPDLDRMRSDLRRDGLAYMADLNALTDAKAKPWTEVYGGVALKDAGENFRHAYAAA